MKMLKISMALVAGLALSPVANAKGCLKGAAGGAVVGHMAGHHAMAGAAGGCALGHHHAHTRMRHRQLHHRKAMKNTHS